MSKYFMILGFVSIYLSSSAFALLPPVGVAYQQLATSFGADPCVKITEPTDFNSVTIRVCKNKQAQAIASLLKQEVRGIQIKVTDQSGKVMKPESISSLNDVAKTVNIAFSTNPYYVKSYLYSPMGLRPEYTLAEFKPEVIAVPIDDISNPYGTHAYVAADLFGMFLNSNAGNMRRSLLIDTAPK